MGSDRAYPEDFGTHKSITFNKAAQDNLPQEVKDKMAADRKAARERFEAQKEILTVERLSQIEPGRVFAQGTAFNNEEGLFMTANWPDKLLKWVAVKGEGYDDWAIYCDFAPCTNFQIKQTGQKVTNKENILKLVPSTEEAYKLYRR